MSDTGSPDIGVDFTINFGDSFGGLKTLDDLIGTVQANAVREFNRIQQAVSGGLGAAEAAAQYKALGSTAARELRTAAQEAARAEKAGEALVRQLERQNSTFGKSRTEVRAMRVEEAALAAERTRNTDLAGRLRTELTLLVEAEARAAAAAEAEAQAIRSAAQAHAMFEDAARRGMAVLREQEKAERAAAVEAERLAAAGIRLRASIDPAFAAQQRFNREIGEARTLISAGAISLDDYVAKLRMEQAALDEASGAHGRVGNGANQMRQAMAGASYQVQDLVTQISMGANPIQAFVIQGGQLAGQFQFVEGRAGAVARFLMGPWGLALQIGMMAAAPLVAKLFEGSKAADAAKKATEEHRKAVLDLAAAQGSALRTAERQQALDAAKIKNELDLAAATRERVKAALELARAQAQDLNSPIGRALSGEGGGAARTEADRRIADLERQIAGQVSEIARLQTGFTKAFARMIEQRAEAESTAEGRIRRDYEARISRAMSQFSGVDQAGKLRAQLDQLYAARDRELKAIEKGTVARDRDTLAASAVAKMLREALPGVRVTSTTGGKHVANSYHYKGQAVDFVPAGGMSAMTKNDVRRIFESRGIDVVELLGPGDRGHSDHFHVAWTKGKLALDGFTDAAKRAAEEKKKLDAVMERVNAVGGLEGDNDFRQMQERSRQVGENQTKTLRSIFGDEAVDALTRSVEQYNDQVRASVGATVDQFGDLDEAARRAAYGMAEAFGSTGRAIGDLLLIYRDYHSARERLDQRHADRIAEAGADEMMLAREQARYARQNLRFQVATFGDMTAAAKGFFKESSDGYRTLATAEKAFRTVEFALSVRAVAQDAIETASSIAKSGARAAAHGVEAVAKAIASLPFPANLVAGAATAAALAAIGLTIAGSFGGGGKLAPTNEGKGTVFGDADAKSESLKRSIDQLRAVDTVTSVYARQMATSLRSIDSQIGGFAAQIVRAGDVNASAGVNTGFKANAIGSILGAAPLIGGFLKSLFGTKTTVVGGGLYGGAQSVGDILSGGFDASTYSDVEKKKKFLGLTTSKRYSTVFGEADADLERQFTLILSSFAGAIGAAAGPLGEATGAVEQRLNGFVLNIGKVDLKGLTGTEIQERLEAIFGAAADGMAEAAMPGITRFQKAGEGAFETLVRVGSTVEAVDTALAQLGGTTRALGIDAKLGLADQFDAIGDLTSAVGDYFAAFYTPAEQAAARASQLTRVFGSMNLVMPDTLNGFRSLVDAQDLTTDAGRATYAELLRLAPAFADLKRELEGTKSAADVLAERGDLQRKLLELNGDTAAIRALDLAKLDASNRGLQEQVWAVQDAQEAAKAADDLRQAWASVGDGIRDEIARIRGLTTTETGGTFAQLLGRFNATNAAARSGDIDAAKSLPQLSQALLTAAGNAATSRQELDRLQTQTAAQLEATYAALKAAERAAAPMTTAKLLADAAASQAAASPAQAANDGAATELRALREEVRQMREQNNTGLAAAANAGNRSAAVLERAEGAAGGVGLAVTGVAA